MVKQDLPLVKPYWFLLYHLPVFHVPQNSFQEDLLHDLPQHRCEIDRLVVPRVILFTLLKMLPFIHSPGTSPDWHDFPNINESGLVTPSANFLRTLGCISLGFIDLWMTSGGHKPDLCLQWDRCCFPNALLPNQTFESCVRSHYQRRSRQKN